jgi:hypothetical protein
MGDSREGQEELKWMGSRAKFQVSGFQCPEVWE